MFKRKNSNPIPNDLIIEILSRLPGKSILRFRCVSKQWRYMLRSAYFIELFRSRSSARPQRLYFAVGEEDTEWSFFSSPQPQILYDDEKSSSLVVTADFHTKLRGEYSTWLEICGPAFGLINFDPRGKDHADTVICNSTTGQYVVLPLPKGGSDKRMGWGNILGFDPIGKQFKVLSISFPRYDGKKASFQILTLGSGKHTWRKISCPIIHFPWYYIPSEAYPEGICINGVLYYIAASLDEIPYMIVCFDVRSEKFKFIYRDFTMYKMLTKLVNYKGKLGVVTLSRGDRSMKLCMWVIKDIEKPESSEWSKCFSYNWENGPECYMNIVGGTSTGEIVLSEKYYSSNEPFNVFYWNPESKTFQSVEIRGFETSQELRRVQVFLNGLVEDLEFIPTVKTYICSNTNNKSNIV